MLVPSIPQVYGSRCDQMHNADAFHIDGIGKFSANFKYFAGDVTKFQAYQLKKAFGVFVTLDEESKPIDISETIESGVWR